MSKPKQRSTYTQGTLDKLFEYHCAMNDMKAAEYIRGLIAKDLKAQYNLDNQTGGVVKIKRS